MLFKQKLLSSFFLLMLVGSVQSQSLRTYAAHSALAQGQWYKIAVSSTGIYKIDYNFIKNNCGFEPSSTDFSKIAVFGNGGGMIPELNATFRYDDIQENAVWRVDNNGNGVMESGDYLLFYAQDANQWFFNSSNKSFYHQKNLYVDANYYFITTTQGTGKTLANAASPSTFTQTVNAFTDYAFHESDDYNLMGSGRRWVGDKMNAYNPSATFNFDFPNRIATDSVRYVTVISSASGYSSTTTLAVNGQTIYAQSISGINKNVDYPNVDISASKSGSFFTSGNTLNFTFNYSNSDQTNSSNGYIDYAEVNVSRLLAMTGSFLLFRNPNTVGAGNTTRFNVSNTNANVKIWDVTDAVNAKNIAAQNGGSSLSFNYATDSIKEFAAVDIYGSFGSPAFSGQISNQDLHGLGALDNIIICDISMLSAAEDLANFHTISDGLHTKAVTTDLIYNEFGSGKQDISAIRDFVKMFYDRANGNSAQMPQYLMLLGDASYDYKNRIAGNTNFVPTYESVESSVPLNSYNTDDFFGCLADNDGGDMGTAQTMEIAVGRMPVDAADEAQAMVEKIKKYKSPVALGDWRNIVTVIGDETAHAGGVDFENQASNLGDYVMQNYPAYNVEKIICDAYQKVSAAGGDRYPDVNTAIINRVNNGALVISYTGHGGVDNLSNGRIFNMSDIQQFANINRLPLFFTATCEFSKFDDPNKKSAGEYLVTNPNGGGIASITTVRPVYISQNYQLQVALFNRLFQEINGRKPTMGELLKNAKNDQLSDPVNTRKFALLGDPALTLNYPEYNIITTAVNNNDSVSQDTLGALKYVTIRGQIQTFDGNLLSSFNGVCRPTVYDKLSTFTTLGQGSPIKETYNIYKNILFKGACTVENGEFEFSFIVPKDINYAIGDGRISYYADNGDLTDAHGFNNSLKIGGATDSAHTDENGPSVRLFINDSLFKSGGLVNENPNLFSILEAQGGINTTGNGLGHDITAVLDGNTNNTFVLNNYYASELNNYQRGTITYPFTNLADGKHTLSLKAWDVYNNSAETEIEFVVSSSAQLTLMDVMNYPNPVVSTTCFSFEHNSTDDDILDVNIQIYTVGGQLMKTIQQSITSENFRSGCIEWDGTTDSGAPVGQGVFVYRLHVRDSTGKTAGKTDRLVVLK